MSSDVYTDRISNFLYYAQEFESEARAFEKLGNGEMAEECKENAAEAFKWAYALMTEMTP